MSIPQYEVVSPAGDPRDAEAASREHSGAPPLPDLKGRTLGLVWTAFTNGDIVLEAFRDHLRERFPDLRFVELPPGRGLTWNHHPHPSIAEVARESGVDAVLITAGC